MAEKYPLPVDKQVMNMCFPMDLVNFAFFSAVVDTLDCLLSFGS